MKKSNKRFFIFGKTQQKIFHFLKNPTKRIHFNYEKIWFFSISDILMESFDLGYLCVQISESALQWRWHQKEPTWTHRDSLPKQISSAQLLISINIWDWSSQPDILTEFIQVSDYGDFFCMIFAIYHWAIFLSGQAGKCWLSANLPLICIKKRLNPCNAQVARSLF